MRTSLRGDEAIRYRITNAIWSCALLLLYFGTAHVSQGSPYADPGDDLLRHDLELLSDHGLINIPMTSWPVMWADVNAALIQIDDEKLSDLTLSIVVHRVRKKALDRTVVNTLVPSYRTSISDNSRRIRTFNSSPRSGLEVEGEFSYTSESLASRLRLTVVANARDGETIRADGSFVAAIIGNTAVSLGWQDKWWGPGWGGTLGLSSNARPIPGLLINRNFSDPFKMPLLKLLGPWSYQVTAGRKESNRAVPNPYLFGMRVNFKPWQQFELGLSRTAQWGGEGRIQSLDSFVDMLLGRDNEGSDGLGDSTEPGNQLAGFDARWTVKRGRRPITLYGQLMGEDEAGGFPSKYLGQFGVSTSMPWGGVGSYLSLRAEYSDTTCQFNENSKIFNCAYNNSQFPTGYRYRGQAIGHSTDNDTRQVLVNGQLNTIENTRYSVTVSVANLNRGGGADFANSLTSVPKDLANIELVHERPFHDGTVIIGAGFDKFDDPVTGKSDTSGRIFIQWSRSRF